MFRFLAIKCHFETIVLLIWISLVLSPSSGKACEGLEFRDFAPEVALITCSNAISDGGFYIAIQQSKDGSYCSYIESQGGWSGGELATARVKMERNSGWIDHFPDWVSKKMDRVATLNIRRETVFRSAVKDDYWFSIQLTAIPTDHKDKHFNGALDIWKNGKHLSPKLYGPMFCDFNAPHINSLLKK